MKAKVNSKWYLRGTLPHIPICENSRRDVSNYYATDLIPATVPGGIHMDLYNAGLIDNPYYDQNSLKCEWTEHRWWIYETDISVNEFKCDKKYLVFEGLDYKCEIYINNESYGERENMFTEKRIDISDIKTDTLNLKVVFKGVVPELGQYGNTSDTKTQKSRFGYGWDFATRLVNIGIWRDVYVEYIEDIRLSESKIYTDVKDTRGIIDVELLFEGKTENDINIEIICPCGKTVAKKSIPYKNKISEILEVENPKLWYPNGMGEQPLYVVHITCGNESYEYKTGIRSLRYLRNPGSPEDSIPYTVEINGKSIYLKGNNKVPLDHLYGNVSYDMYEWLIKALVNENVNLVRVWGGGIIETEEFYNLCDQYGILVWQDFIQSSSGIENIPSKDKGFLEKLKDAAIAATKEKRNHVSLTIWTGGNELTESDDVPVKYTDENIAMLKKVVEENDPSRIFFPSTPSGPVYRLEFDNPNNHDVHSPWEYCVESHYNNYNNLKLLLHSEFGISGPSASTELFLKENASDLPSRNGNTHHGEFWWHSYRRDKKLFGEFETTDAYVPYGQWIQAEGLRYTIETERRMAPRASGSMIWQINEPWPNADCSNLMDYFGNPKMAYYWAKAAFSDCNVSLKYDSVYCEKELKAEIFAYGDIPVNDEEFTAYVYNDEGNVIKEYKLNVKDSPFSINAGFEKENQMLMVRLSHRGVNKEYYFSNDKEYIYRPSRNFKKTELSCEICKLSGEGIVKTGKATVKNTGNKPAYFVYPKDKNLNYAILASDAYFSLLPGEEKEIDLTVRERTGLFFDKVNAEPEIVFDYINS